ncbi:single-stranded-DNA-specific exonuclease [Candidatus Magnetomoraceae bacterium gMMP-1]
MKKHWRILQPDLHLVEDIKKSYGCHHITASVLANRNFTDLTDIKHFLNPSFKFMRSPFFIKDMDIAAGRIISAIKKKEKILIFGDYDVDGITSVTILLEFLQCIGANVSYYIPHRSTEGYGLKKEQILNHALPEKINLIITVDCGIASFNAVETANKHGIDVIITDHHEVSSKLPDAVAVIDPKRSDCNQGFDYLAGVGVAFCLIICLRKYLRDQGFWKAKKEPNLKEYCDLVSLGTIADIVPLVGENRIFAKTGLGVISQAERIGIRALKEVSGIKKAFVNASDVSFRLAPRLNAAGRLGHASIAVDLLTCSNMEKAKEIAKKLNEINSERQGIEKSIFYEIKNSIKKHPNLIDKKSLVIDQKGWLEGVIGIVASRLVENYFRPTVLISITNGMGKGSARSIPGFNLYEGLNECGHHFEAFGGHAMAAGLSIKPEKIEAFKQDFERVVRERTVEDDFKAQMDIDYCLDFKDIAPNLINELENLDPFGADNREPIFAAKNVKVSSSSIVGTSHRRMSLTQDNGFNSKKFNAIQFNINPKDPIPDVLKQVAFKLQWNYWNGRKSIQLLVEEIMN